MLRNLFVSRLQILVLFIFFISCRNETTNIFSPTIGAPADSSFGRKLRIRSAKEIGSSTWSIGGETLDRDYADYNSYKKYLGPLGAKRIRLQGGWAKCEKVRGHFDFGWLDSIVNDVTSQGIRPWIQLSYGNSVYKGGGQAKLGSDLPSSPEALLAWDYWVRAMVTRYKSQVKEWEVWNEPDSGPNAKAEAYTAFYIRTAETIRSIQPDAKLMAFGLAGVHRVAFVENFFKKLKEENKINLVDILTYHGYDSNPDTSYPKIENLQRVVRSYAPEVEFMQGENGAPSMPKGMSVGALSDQDWSELTQAKWDLRRMLGDHGRGIATNLFTISDMHYKPGDGLVGINSKGLLKANPDKTIEKPKLAYKAAQHVFSLFDDFWILSKENLLSINQNKMTAFCYKHKTSNFLLITLWSTEDRPRENYTARPTTVTIKGSFNKPAVVDMVSGQVFLLPESNWKSSDDVTTFVNIGVPDYPILITDLSVL